MSFLNLTLRQQWDRYERNFITFYVKITAICTTVWARNPGVILDTSLFLKLNWSQVLSMSPTTYYVLSRFSCVWLAATLWTVAHQALLSMELSRQEYWSRLPFSSPGDLPNPGTEPRSPASAGRQILYLLRQEKPHYLVLFDCFPLLLHSLVLFSWLNLVFG